MANKKRETLGGRIGYPGADQEAEARSYHNEGNAASGYDAGEPEPTLAERFERFRAERERKQNEFIKDMELRKKRRP